MKHANRFPYLILALLAAWLVAGTAGIAFTDRYPDTLFMAFALLLFTAVLAAASLFRFSAIIAVLVSLVAYNVVVFSLRPMSSEMVLPLIVANLAIIGAGVLGWFSARQIARLQTQLEHSNSVINDLRIKDPNLGTVRLPYALQTLKTEVLRSQRYQSSLCLLKVKMADEEEIKKDQGEAAFLETKRQMSAALGDLIREMDLLFGQENFGVILPETNGEAAMIVSRRIIDNIARKVRVGVHIGLAEFGVDAFSDDELMRAADTAMELAERTDRPVVTFAQVRSVTEPEPEKSSV